MIPETSLLFLSSSFSIMSILSRYITIRERIYFTSSGPVNLLVFPKLVLNCWKHVTKSFLFLLMHTSYMSFPMFITKIIVTFCALRSSHSYISAITIFTLWRFLRHFSKHRYLVKVSKSIARHTIQSGQIGKYTVLMLLIGLVDTIQLFT